MKLSPKRQFWFDHIQKCTATGLGMSDYANEHDLDLKQFYQMKYQLRKDGIYPRLEASTKKAPAFSKVTVKKSKPKELPTRQCELVFGDGLVLRFDPSIDSAQIKTLAAMLRGQPY